MYFRHSRSSSAIAIFELPTFQREAVEAVETRIRRHRLVIQISTHPGAADQCHCSIRYSCQVKGRESVQIQGSHAMQQGPELVGQHLGLGLSCVVCLPTSGR